MKAWKWTLAFLLDRSGREEDVHQHRLAAADRAVDVETLGGASPRSSRRRPMPRRAPQRSSQLAIAARLIILQRIGDRLQLRGSKFLRRVMFQPTARLQRAIGGKRSVFRRH